MAQICSADILGRAPLRGPPGIGLAVIKKVSAVAPGSVQEL